MQLQKYNKVLMFLKISLSLMCLCVRVCVCVCVYQLPLSPGPIPDMVPFLLVKTDNPFPRRYQLL